MDFSIEDQERLSHYPERTRVTRIPFGYKRKDPSSDILIPIPEIIIPLDKALDQVDAGIPVRQAAEWLNLNTPEDISISHMGLIKIRKYYRPHIVRKLASKPKIKKKTREEKLELARKMKLAGEKRKITNAKKRMAKLEEELEIIHENKVEVDNTPLLEIDYGSEEYKSVVEEQEIEIIFKPNPGPQTEFFAAEELEVLYGGAAGGELKSESYRLLSQ